MGTNIIQLRCNCGTTIRSENVMGTMVYCHACDSYNIITNNELFQQATSYRITRFKGKARDFRQVLFNYLYENGDVGLFNRMTSFTLDRCYMPVLEIGTGDRRQFVQLNETDYVSKRIFKTKDTLEYLLTKRALPDSKTKSLNLTDHQPLYAQRETEKIRFLPIDIPMDKIAHNYVARYDTINIRYIPVFILKTNLVDIICVGSVDSGDDENFVILNRGEVYDAISRKKTSLITDIKEWLKLNLLNLGILTIVGSVIYGIYKIFTIGITGRFLFELIMKTIQGIFTVLGTCLMLGILLVALWVIFKPAIVLIASFIKVFKGERHRKPNYRKGRALMGLNN